MLSHSEALHDETIDRVDDFDQFHAGGTSNNTGSQIGVGLGQPARSADDLPMPRTQALKHNR